MLQTCNFEIAKDELEMRGDFPLPKTYNDLMTWPTMPAHHDGYILFWYGSSIIGVLFCFMVFIGKI